MSGYRGIRQAGWLLLLALGLPQAVCGQNDMTIRAISFLGNTTLAESDLRRAIRSAPGRPYVAGQIADDIARIERLYADRGYTLARVRDAEFNGERTLRFSIVEGIIDRVTVVGNHRTRRDVLCDLVQLRPGQVYNEQMARADRRRLARLGVFDRVMLEPVAAQEAGRVDLRLRVRERATAYLHAVPVPASHEGVIGYLEAGEENFLGRAQKLHVQWQRGVNVDDSTQDARAERRNAVLLRYEDPLPRLRRPSFGLDLYHCETVFAPVFTPLALSPRMFALREGATVRMGTALSEDAQAFLSYRRDRVNFDATPSGLLSAAEQADSRGTLAGVTLSGRLSRERRYGALRRGYTLEAQAEFGARVLGGSFDYRKLTVEARGALPLGRGTLALRALAGTATGGTPLSEQFWLGGFETLRGYDFDAFHGTRAAYLSAEWLRPVLPGIQAAFYLEDGMAWGRGASVRLSSLRFSGGMGLRFASPFGPLRFDMATGSRSVHLYLSLGQAF